LFASFILFGVLAACDFYRWNYEYGHNLDPNAAIKVPGMSYQPPLLGYKQLLNFGAYSVPDIGGWMLLICGVLLFGIALKESQLLNKWRKPKAAAPLLAFLAFTIFSCSNAQAVPIVLNSDNCAFCGMSIADGKYGAEVITAKGRAYKFDDIMCMMNYCKANAGTKMASYFVHDYAKENQLIPATFAFFLSGGEIQSPMRGGIIAFATEKEAREFNAKLNATLISWDDVLKK
jgi:copper chaperone NosL